MTDIKPDVIAAETLRDYAAKLDTLITQGEQILRRLDHHDAQIHDILRYTSAVNTLLEQYAPAITRAAGLLDTGAKFRGFLAKHRD